MSIYSRFTADDVVEANPTVITTGLWSEDRGELSSSLYVDKTTGGQINTSGDYYVDVYNRNPETDELAEVQFSITYGHIDGGGSPGLDINDQAKLQTKAIYSQYRNLLLDPTDTRFSFKGIDSDHIYVINFQRARIREQLDPGNWQLHLSGTQGIQSFIDDSGQTLGALTANSKAGRVFSVVSGSILNFRTTNTSSLNSSTWGTDGPGYGLVYPDLGIIVLNPEAIGPCVGFLISSASGATTGSAASIGINSAPMYSSLDDLSTDVEVYAPVTQSLTEIGWGSKISAYNHAALFTSINLASKVGKGFTARSAETISSTHFFVRLRNKEFNYSNNPTFYNADNGSLVLSDFKNDPKVYVTTVGLFNDQNELLAVAKLSKPVRKSFDEEALLRVRLDF
jgi:hypothetical protein